MPWEFVCRPIHFIENEKKFALEKNLSIPKSVWQVENLPEAKRFLRYRKKKGRKKRKESTQCNRHLWWKLNYRYFFSYFPLEDFCVFITELKLVHNERVYNT